MEAGTTPKTAIPIYLAFLCGCLLLQCFSLKVLSQHIPIANPSLEGRPAENDAPPGWSHLNTADIQPGVYNIRQKASDGNTCEGMHSGPFHTEGISQQLAGTMKAGYYYRTYFDLLHTPVYAYDACYGNLAIYGGNQPGELKELLWSTGRFYHTDWRRYDALFTPSADYSYITFISYYSDSCDKSKYGAAMLMDNLSPWLYQQLKLEFSTTVTCANNNTGAVAVKVLGGSAPYTYQWSPAVGNTPALSNLPAGKYEVTVTDSKGVSAQGSAVVNITDLATQVTVTPSHCHGDGLNAITLQTSGGLPPYRYYFNGSTNSTISPVFDKLQPGVYNVKVRDEQGCLNELKDILVEEPPLLELRSINVKPCSCSEVNNGRIVPQVTGGVPPYQYRVNNDPWEADSVLGNLGPGNYQYEVKDSYGCSITGVATVISPYANCLVILPNAFSPNGDGNNDVFRPKVYDDVHNYQLRIYNRWGSLVFSTSDPGTGWNGSYRGSPMPAQHYSYICTYTDRNNVPQELKGVVMLLR